MPLPLSPPVEPQLARSAKQLPLGEQWAYEPKFDGFRAIAFVDGDEVYIQSRSGRPLGRYFPEVTFAPGRYIVDGEIVIDAVGWSAGLRRAAEPPAPGGLAGTAAGRADARRTSSRSICWRSATTTLLELPYAERRTALTEVTVDYGIDLTPSTTDPDATEPWLAGGEGVVAKELGAPYRPGQRKGMVKVKRVRTIDAVVVGYRPGKEPGTVGSLILGLYDPDGELHVVGHSSGLRAAEKRALVDRLAPYETGDRGHGDPSRWKSEKELEWISLRPELVVEITFDHASDGRIRHGTKILRWRDDKPPRECALAQMQS